jgi:hypothetical protein
MKFYTPAFSSCFYHSLTGVAQRAATGTDLVGERSGAVRLTSFFGIGMIMIHYRPFLEQIQLVDLHMHMMKTREVIFHLNTLTLQGSI